MARSSASKAKIKLDTSMRVVVLHGKERMIQQLRLRELLKLIEQEYGETEPLVVDGPTASLSEVFDELRTFGLMQAHKVVVIEEAEAFVKEHRAALERYAEDPAGHATLVLRSPVWRKGKLDKLIEKVGAVVACEPPTAREAAAWLSRRAGSEHAVELRPDAAARLVERLGVDLARLDQELGKLAAMVDEGVVRTEDVDRVVGRTSEEQAWVVQDALVEAMRRGRAEGLLSEVRELIDLAGQPEVLVTYFMADGVRKLSLAQRYAARRVGGGEIAKRLKLWGARQRTYLDAAGRLDPALVSRLFDEAVGRDARTKRGLGSARRNLETLCVCLSDKSF